MSERKRALSASAASECENAKHPQCRCGGKMHGATRGKLGGLPLDDPHSPSVECLKCGGTGKRMVPDYSATLPEGEWSYPPIEADCMYCNGKGRFIKPKVLREMAALGEMSEVAEG